MLRLPLILCGALLLASLGCGSSQVSNRAKPIALEPGVVMPEEIRRSDGTLQYRVLRLHAVSGLFNEYALHEIHSFDTDGVTLLKKQNFMIGLTPPRLASSEHFSNGVRTELRSFRFDGSLEEVKFFDPTGELLRTEAHSELEGVTEVVPKLRGAEAERLFSLTVATGTPNTQTLYGAYRSLLLKIQLCTVVPVGWNRFEDLHPESEEELRTMISLAAMAAGCKDFELLSLKERNEQVGRYRGSYAGLGVAIERQPLAESGVSQVVITQVHRGGPAHKAGFWKNDILVSIDGHDVGKSFNEEDRKRLLVREIGEQCKVVVKHGELTITRDVVYGMTPIIELRAAEHHTWKGDRHFLLYQPRNLDWHGLVGELDGILGDERAPTQIALDLRGASGNDPNIAAQVIARFYHSDLPLVGGVRGPIDGWREVYIASKPPTVSTAKLVVLVDANTSGTAEVIAETLQSIGRATVRGAKTAGKPQLTEYSETVLPNRSKLYVRMPSVVLQSSKGGKLGPVTPDVVETFAENDEAVVERVRASMSGGLFGGNWLPIALMVGAVLAAIALRVGIKRWLKSQGIKSPR